MRITGRGIFLNLFLLFSPFISYSQSLFAVVELYTSQGCLSCPAADEIFSEIKRESEKSGKRVYFLEYHVDYWNKSGWKDPFSKNQFTIRQENYSRVLPGKEMFTPQVIINGSASFTGSEKKEIKSCITRMLSTTSVQASSIPPPIKIDLTVDSTKHDTAFISYTINNFKGAADYSLRLVLTEDGLSTKITGGENDGKTVHNDGVVRYFYSVNSPGNGNFKIPVGVFTGIGKKKLIAFVQKKKTMTIEAVTSVDITSKQ